LLANPDDFGDAGLLGGAAGNVGQGGASQGGSGTGVGGSASGTAGAGGAGIAGMPVGLSGGGGLPVTAGAGGSGTGTGGTAVVGGSGGTTGGTAAGTAGTTAGGTGGTGAGTGGTGSTAVFDPSACDFTDETGCEALTCQARCPTGDGGSCLNRCVPVVDCVIDEVAENPTAHCATAADPLCGARAPGNGAENACTTVVEPAGGPNPAPPNGNAAPSPAFVARQFVECICSLPRP